MAEKLTLLHIDAATGIETIRELTSDERTDLAAINANSQQRKQEAEAKAAARESALAKLAALGLTEEEIGALYCQLTSPPAQHLGRSTPTKVSLGYTTALAGMFLEPSVRSVLSRPLQTLPLELLLYPHLLRGSTLT